MSDRKRFQFVIRNNFCGVQRRYDLCLLQESIHDNSARREAHEQTAAGGCECIQKNGHSGQPPVIVFEIGTTPTVSSYFVTSLEL